MVTIPRPSLRVSTMIGLWGLAGLVVLLHSTMQYINAGRVPNGAPQHLRAGLATQGSRGAHDTPLREAQLARSRPTSSIVGLALIGSSLLAARAGAASITAKTANSPTALKAGGGRFNPTTEVGAGDPLGFFDPLGFTTDEQSFRHLRAAEIKHGRVAMMASIGALVPSFFRFPGFEEYTGTFNALSKMLAAGDPTILAFLGGFVATCGIVELVFKEDPNKEPGNFGDPAGFAKIDGFGYTDEMRTKELNNGRMAMIAILGIFAAEFVTGQDATQQLLQLFIGSWR